MSEISPYTNGECQTTARNPRTRKRIPSCEVNAYDNLNHVRKARKINGITMRNWKPSYCLKCDVTSEGSFQADSESLRSRHRKKLRRLLNILMLQHNWIGASGVLSVLLKGTIREKSLSRNQYKYWATLELLKKIKCGDLNAYKVKKIYDLWMKKLGSAQDKAVQLDSILFSLCQGNTSVAQVAADELTQDRGFGSDSIANFVVGLTYCQLWYSTIPKEFQLEESNRPGTPVQSIQSECRTYMSFNNSDGHDAVDTNGVDLPLECHSSTSVGNQKHNSKVIVEEPCNRIFRVGSPETESAEKSGIEEEFQPNQIAEIPNASIFYTRGLPPWLLPMKLPESTENMEKVLYMHKDMLNNSYTDALKHLRAALHLEPPVFEALHPLIQMLLLGDQVMEALGELESVSHKLDTSLYKRLKGSIVEYFDHSNDHQLCKHFEDILKKDPTCSHTLAKLVQMHQDGLYGAVELVEMIGLHLEAVVGDDSNTWKEMASCFYKLSYFEGDQMSTCNVEQDDNEPAPTPTPTASDASKLDGGDGVSHRKRISALFTNPKTKHTWLLRCRWWITRHFSPKRLALDIASGDKDLLTYKAVIASYLYGNEVIYSVKAAQHLTNENMMDMLAILQLHCL